MIALHSHLSQILDQLKPLLQSTAKNLLRHLHDEPIAQAQGTFADFEEFHLKIQRAMTVEIMQQALQLHADTMASLPPPDCPHCSQPTQRREPRPRRLETDSGLVQWNEPECHCDHCRRAFFPSER